MVKWTLLFAAMLLSACGTPEERAQRRAAYVAEQDARTAWLQTPDGKKVKLLCEYKAKAATAAKTERGLFNVPVSPDPTPLTNECIDVHRKTGVMPTL